MFKLRLASSKEWPEAVLGDFDAFLIDHAGCERKASATAMSLVSHYPDRRVLVQEMTQLAREELEHFRPYPGVVPEASLNVLSSKAFEWCRLTELVSSVRHSSKGSTGWNFP